MDSEQTHFDSIAPHYYEMVDAVAQDNGYYHREELGFVRRVLGAAQVPLRVLDAGAGPGRISRALVEQGHAVVALDISAAMLMELPQDDAGPDAVQADVRRLPFANASFDGVVCMEVLEHLPGHADDALQVIEECSRILTDDGLLLIEAPLRPHEELRLSHPAFRADWSRVSKQVWRRYEQAPLGTWLHYEDTQVTEMLAASGFEVLGARYVRVLPAGLFDHFEGLEAIDHLLERQARSAGLAREAIWVARRRPRNGASGSIAHIAFDPAALDIPTPAPEDIRTAATGLAEVVGQLEGARKQLAAREKELERATAARAAAEREAQVQKGRWAWSQGELEAIHDSTGWALLQRLWATRTLVAPAGSGREHVLKQSVRVARAAQRLGVRGTVRRALSSLPPPERPLLGLLGMPELFTEGYVPEDNSVVTLYSDDASLFPDYRPRRFPRAVGGRAVEVSLVATMRNERDSIERWVRDVLAQTRLPDEIIVVDGGSDDGSPDRLRLASAGSPVPFRILELGPTAIARSRNAGIEAAVCPVIAVTDLGAGLHPRWLERITAPFALDPATEVVGGFYVAENRHGAVLRRRLWPRLDQVWPQSFIPSSRSLAFRRSAWDAVRGYPEWLSLTGEDTYFALELKRYCRNWAFVPDAVVYWDAPESRAAYWRKAYGWSVGDGESGISADTYRRSALIAGGVPIPGLVAAVGALTGSRPVARAARLAAGLAVAGGMVAAGRSGLPARSLPVEYGAQVNRVRGFVHGWRRREEVTRRRERDHRGLLLLLAGVPIDDTGGGARCTQITLELLRQGWKVVYVNRFPKHESVDLRLHIAHPDLETHEWSQFDIGDFLAIQSRIGGEVPVAALVEFPLPEFLPVLRRLDQAGVTIVYDLIDDWDTSLGAGWYSMAAEREYVDRADVLLGTAPALVDRLERMAGEPATFLPNAVNLRLFDPDRPHPPPPDLPEAAWRIAYVGALWGDWFDWDLLIAVARRYPESAVVVVGDYRGQCPERVDNLYFLGLRAQRELPAYLANVDVAIIPWKINDVTRATSPLKLYEYLAMRKPVVAPDLPPLHDIPFTLLSTTREDFLADVARARELDVSGLQRFLAANSWQARAQQLTELIEKASDRGACDTSRRSAGGSRSGSGPTAARSA